MQSGTRDAAQMMAARRTAKELAEFRKAVFDVEEARVSHALEGGQKIITNKTIPEEKRKELYQAIVKHTEEITRIGDDISARRVDEIDGVTRIMKERKAMVEKLKPFGYKPESE